MKTREMVYVAMFAAVMGVLGILPAVAVPFMPADITLQTFGVMLAGAVLGARLGFISLFLYLLLVAAGLPLISGGTGGLGVFATPSGGFFLSWPFAALFIGFLTDWVRPRPQYWHLVVFNILGGIGIVYLIGVPFMAWMSGIPVWTAAIGSLVFLPGDFLKAIVAAYLAVKIRRALPSLHHVTNRRIQNDDREAL